MTPSMIRQKFFQVISDAETNSDLYVKNPGSDMTRHRTCDFSNTILTIISFAMNRSNTELFTFFEDKNLQIPSKSAFCQQRKKFNSLLFPTILQNFNNSVPFKKTYKGYHLVAVDGSDLNLPTCKNDKEYCVKQARSDNYYYQMHLNALFDICENRYLSAVMQPRPKMEEKEAFLQMVAESNMPANTIFIADRGYISYNTLARLIELGRFFLIRSKAPSSPGSLLRHLVKDDAETDQFVTVCLTRSKKKRISFSADKLVTLTTQSKFEAIPLGDRTSFYSMKLRITCVKLGDDSYEYLISNLPIESFNAVDLKGLYWKRWAIETSFRSLKYALALSHLHSVNRELITQEVYAKLILYNLTSLIHDYVQSSKELADRNRKTKYQYKVSFDDTVPVVRKMLKQKIKNSTIKALLLRHLTAVKVNLKSPRRKKSQTVRPLNNRA